MIQSPAYPSHGVFHHIVNTAFRSSCRTRECYRGAGCQGGGPRKSFEIEICQQSASIGRVSIQPSSPTNRVVEIFGKEVLNAFFTSKRLRLIPSRYHARSRPLVMQYLRRRAVCDTHGTSKVTDALQRTAAELANTHPDLESKLGGLSFAMAAYLAEEEVLRVLEHQISEAIDCDDDSAHVLAAAAFIGDQKLVESLLSSGGKPNTASNLFGTPLQAAAGNGQIGIVRYLLRNGAQINHFSDIALSLKGLLSAEHVCPTLRFSQQQRVGTSLSSDCSAHLRMVCSNRAKDT